jgi:hypothetical protein
MNRMLAPMGLGLGDGMLERDRKGGGAGIRVSKEPPAMLHARAALELLASTSKGGGDAQLLRDKKADLAQAAETVMSAGRSLPAEAEIVKRLRVLASAGGTPALPSPAKPLRQTDGLARVLLALQLRDAANAPGEQVKAHPAAAAFPGAVPAGAVRVSRTVAVDLRVPRWHSTGLYAAAGEVVTVTLPADGAAKGLRLRVGPHTDRTYHLASWHRAPEISRQFTLERASTKVASAFGGLIYVDVPEKSAGAGTVEVTIGNAVEAPLFVLGKTTMQEWRAMRERPAPWAELATDKLVITTQSEAIRALEDPAEVMRHWDRVMDASATLAAWPLGRRSPERIVTDADISAGYMHSGYPIMTGLDVVRTIVDLEKLLGDKDGWGFYHEIGHNHQSADWTFGGTTEVTVNLFTMHTLETVCGLTREQSTRRALGAERAKRIAAYLAKPDFEAWKADPFLALAMYAQLRVEFGWEPYKKVFAEYRALAAGERLKTEIEKRDQWMVRMSRAVGRNLGPFFEAWGVPTSAGARQSVADLPGWMPN